MTIVRVERYGEIVEMNEDHFLKQWHNRMRGASHIAHMLYAGHVHGQPDVSGGMRVHLWPETEEEEGLFDAIADKELADLVQAMRQSVKTLSALHETMITKLAAFPVYLWRGRQHFITNNLVAARRDLEQAIALGLDPRLRAEATDYLQRIEDS